MARRAAMQLRAARLKSTIERSTCTLKLREKQSALKEHRDLVLQVDGLVLWEAGEGHRGVSPGGFLIRQPRRLCCQLTCAGKTPTVASHSAAVAARKDRRSTGRAVLPEGGPLNFMIHMQDVMAKPMPDFREGSIVKGRILEVRPREVLVDVGYKSEGVIPLAEFDDVESLEVGDEVDVLLERLENDEGMVVLSKEKA